MRRNNEVTFWPIDDAPVNREAHVPAASPALPLRVSVASGPGCGHCKRELSQIRLFLSQDIDNFQNRAVPGSNPNITRPASSKLVVCT
jgi:hypothetical protein